MPFKVHEEQKRRSNSKKEKRKKEKNDPKKLNKGKAKFGIGKQIMVCFLVPVVFVVIVGMQAYNSAAKGMRMKYEQSTLEALKMTVEYVDLGSEFIASEGLKYAFTTNLSNYYVGLYKNDAAGRVEILKDTNDMLKTAKVSNSFINNIHIITKPGIAMLTTKTGSTTSTPDGFYKEFVADLEAIYGEGQIPKWIDSHPLLDEKLNLVAEETIFSYTCLATSSNAYVVIDMNKQAVLDLLEKLDLGNGSVVGMVTAGGSECVAGVEDAEFFTALPCYQECMSSDETEGYREISFKGEKSLFLYSRNEEGNFSICALTPMRTVTSQAESIRVVTVMMVVLACLAAFIVAVFISSKIGRNMKKLMESMAKVADGDLTALVKSRGKDEFSLLNGSMNNMVHNTGKLVKKVADSTRTLGNATRSVTESAGIINEYSENITSAIGEIHTGMNVQTENAQECLQKTDALSDEIQVISSRVEDTEKLIEATGDSILQGIETMNVLDERARQTSFKTDKVEKSILLLQEQFSQIQGFVETIDGISEETNLLSLNASIEAARAGESGRGFAVVADQIRKLAEGASSASSQIQKTVKGIQEQAQVSVDDARAAREMVRLQSQAVEEIQVAFSGMQQHMADVIEQMKEIANNTEKADAERSATLQAIENISAVIEETAAAAAVVNDTAERMLIHAGKLKGNADVLEDNMKNLEEEISSFKTE